MSTPERGNASCPRCGAPLGDDQTIADCWTSSSPLNAPDGTQESRTSTYPGATGSRVFYGGNESPGFWEFLGSLNPLEVIRRYLNDRHERAKDRTGAQDHRRQVNLTLAGTLDRIDEQRCHGAAGSRRERELDLVAVDRDGTVVVLAGALDVARRP